MQVSIIIPCFNEASRLATTFQKLVEYENGTKHTLQFVFVNDGSTDNTYEAIKWLVKTLESPTRIISYPKNKGKGFAVKTGLIESDHDHKLVLDADLSISIENLDKVPIKDGYYIVKGRRKYTNLPITRRVLGIGWHGLTRLLTDMTYDSQSPFSFMRLPNAFFKLLTCDGFSFDVEILMLAKKLHYPIEEIDVDYDFHSGSKVTFKKTIAMTKELLKLKLR